MNQKELENFIHDVLEDVHVGQRGQWSARCPLHNDERSSLSINVLERVWICHAGCGQGRLGQLFRRLDDLGKAQ